MSSYVSLEQQLETLSQPTPAAVEESFVSHPPQVLGTDAEDLRGLHVLFVHPSDATFIRTDLALLRTFCDVVSLRFQGKASYPRLAAGVARADLVVSWFALGFAGFASILGKTMRTKSILIAGGWDVAAMPEIGYGRLLTEWGDLTARVSLSMANRVLAFSEWSRQRIHDVAPRAKAHTAYLGVDTGRFRPSAKAALVVTTGGVKEENLRRKGLRAFVDSARSVPEAEFVLLGPQSDGSAEELLRDAPANLSIPGWVPDNELQEILSRAKVYVQPSYTEGFGVALVEAMASGCVPVVTPVGAIPEVVGDAGLYVRYGDHEGLAGAIRQALGSDLGGKARQRVESHFTLSHRLNALRAAVAEVTGRVS